ncbi:MAG: hypothetical protein ACRDMV_01310 [Streptosporangiales bacterium]
MSPRLPRWVMEAPFLVPVAALCAAYGGYQGLILFQTSEPTGAIERAYPLWTVVALSAALGIGGVMVLVARPTEKLRAEVVGLGLAGVGLFTYAVADAVHGSYLNAVLLLLFAGALGVRFRVTQKAIQVRTMARAAVLAGRRP